MMRATHRADPATDDPDTYDRHLPGLLSTAMASRDLEGVRIFTTLIEQEGLDLARIYATRRRDFPDIPTLERLRGAEGLENHDDRLW